MKQYLRHTDKGTIYNYNERMLDNPNLEVVTEEEAFPAKFKSPKQKKRESKVSMEEVQIDMFDATPPALAAEAAKGMP